MRDPDEGLTPDGMIRTGADSSRVPTLFEPVVAAMIDAFDEVRGATAELHLYGSVATGTARAGISDVDIVAIDVPLDWAGATAARLSTQFASVCRGVEIGVAGHGDYVGEDDQAYGNRVFLRHYCVPLAGPDALRSPASFPGDARAARGFNGDIEIRLARWRHMSADARRVARKTLLAAAGVVSIRTGTWTTDRATAARSWGDFDLSRAAGMEALLGWADGAIAATPRELSTVLAPDGIVAEVADRFARDIGLWQHSNVDL